jgi:hypothetical protein
VLGVELVMVLYRGRISNGVRGRISKVYNLVAIVLIAFLFFLTVATVQFLSNQYYVNETDNSVRIAVILTGSVAQSTVVRYDI